MEIDEKDDYFVSSEIHIIVLDVKANIYIQMKRGYNLAKITT